MSEKRRDNKKRILQEGESQRKDGRYVYTYKDRRGKRHSIYSWRLTSADPIPAGKRWCEPLREMKKPIQQKLMIDYLDPMVEEVVTVLDLYALYQRYHPDVAPNTQDGRETLARHLAKDGLGNMPIGKVRTLDAKDWVLRLRDAGYARNTIERMKSQLKSTFELAVDETLLKRNPFAFPLSSIIRGKKKRGDSLTQQQEHALIDFLRTSDAYGKHLDMFIILLGTGLRISEFCGLTKDDVDMDTRRLTVDHQLLRSVKLGRYIKEPKTESGFRIIPMSEPVRAAFVRALNKQAHAKPFKIGRYKNFLFTTRNGTPYCANNIDLIFRRVLKAYNESPNTVPINVMTPHTLRHTFCTRMANDGMNPKALQYIMGHSTIDITMNYYAHADAIASVEEMERHINELPKRAKSVNSEEAILTLIPTKCN